MRYFQLIDTLVTQVVLDRRGLDNDFSTTYGVSVGSIISKFSDEDALADGHGMCPGGTIGHGVLADDFKSFRAFAPDDQLGVALAQLSVGGQARDPYPSMAGRSSASPTPLYTRTVAPGTRFHNTAAADRPTHNDAAATRSDEPIAQYSLKC